MKISRFNIYLVAILGIVPLISGGARSKTDQRRPVANKIDRLLDAIREVETGAHPDPANARGDGGRSLGPYQITWAYWKDSGVAGRYERVRNRTYAKRVMIAYWQRYCPQALAKGDCQTLARVHNGGPNGLRMAKTAGYWLKVRRTLDQ